MNIGKGSSKLPHHLRFVILLLRVAIGLSFFYAVSYENLQTPTQWAFFAIGALLVIGLITRIASIIGIVLIMLSYWPSININFLSVARIVNDQLILMICLLILIFSNAGTYIGLDAFIHIKTGKTKE